jgi:hypothetical protein
MDDEYENGYTNLNNTMLRPNQALKLTVASWVR